MGSFKITAPAADFSGEVVGVHFVRGVGTATDDTDGAALAYFRRRGYVVERADEPAAEPSEPSVDLPDDDAA